MNFILTKDQETINGKIKNCSMPKETITVSLTSDDVDDFILNKLSEGIRLPNEIGKYIIDDKLKKAWSLGWRGKLQYFQ